MKDKIIRFLRNAYGFDKLSKHIYYLGLAFFLIAILSRIQTLRFIALFLMVISLIRSFSRKRNARYQELVLYNRVVNRIKTKYKVLSLNIKHFKTHKYVVCKQCNQQIRLPKKQGKIVVTCPRCKNKFDVRT